MSCTNGKVVFVGDAAVGKTSVINSYMNFAESPSPTIVSTNNKITVDISNDENVDLTVWDTAGQDDYRCLVPVYVRGAQVAVIVFDQTNPTSFHNILSWIQFLNKSNDVPHIILCQNKMDLQPAVSDDEVDQLCQEENLEVYHTSALNGDGIQNLFYAIASKVATSIEPLSKPTVELDQPKESSEKTSKNCSC